MSKEKFMTIVLEWSSGRERYRLKEKDARRIMGKCLLDLATHAIYERGKK